MEEFKVENGKAIIPEGREEIPYGVFENCKDLTSVEIPLSVKKIAGFQGCKNLKSIEIPASVTGIDYDAFDDCSGLETITVSAGNEVFESPEGSNAIIERESKTLVLGCKNTNIPSGVKVVEDSAFNGCSELRKIELPSSVMEIRDNAFYNCTGLYEVVLPPSLKKIGTQAFYKCNLQKIIIPSSVTTIDTDAFYGCYKLKCVEFLGRVDCLDFDALGCHPNIILVPANMKDIYKAMLQKELHDRIVENGKISEEEIRLRMISAVLSGRFANNEYGSLGDSECKRLATNAIKIADEIIHQLKLK